MKVVVEVSDFLYKQILKRHVGTKTIARIFENVTTLSESDDAVSRQAVIDEIHKAQDSLKSDNDKTWERNKGYFKGLAWANRIVLDAFPVLPKREENTVSEEVYTEEYTQRKALEFENYMIKKREQDKSDFLRFLMETINPNEMETYMQMYKSNGETQDSEVK